MTRKWVAWVTLLGGALLAQPAKAASGRYLYFISDSHFGVGHEPDGRRWDSYEDARWPDDLAAFVDYVDRSSGGRADLVVNGDTFELWQSREVPCKYGRDKQAGCSAPDAHRRLERVLTEHAREMKILGDFTRKGTNHLFFVVGNHDVALLLPGMEELLRAALRPMLGRFQLMRTGFWESDDHLVLAEHGHEIPTDPNAFPNWPNVVVTRNRIAHVPRPWGEQFVQEFYNQFENKYPAIDNFTSDGAGISYALAAENFAGSALGVASFLKFLAFRESWKQFGQALGTGGDSPQWNVAAERKKGSQFLVESFPEGEGIRSAVTDGNRHDVDRFVRNARRLSDDEIREICDARWERSKQGQAVMTCEGNLGADEGTLSSIVDSVLRKRDLRIIAHLAQWKKSPRLFIYSHTHSADHFALSDSNISVFNTGAWQRLLTKDEFEKELVGGKNPTDVFRKLTPDDLIPCYTFVVVEPYRDLPTGALKSWRHAGPGTPWEVSDKECH